MQGSGEASDATEVSRLEDDMALGDLGDGMGKRLQPPAPALHNSRVCFGYQQNLPTTTELFTRECKVNDGGLTWTSLDIGPYTSFKERSGLPASLNDLSKEELRERLQEATEALEVLRSELEVTHRYLEGKYEALKILQGKTILDKATTHTKNLLQKSEERAKALEKEVNGLQWEITSNQVQLKKSELSWEQKFNSIYSENEALSKSMGERLNEIRELKAENTVLGQRCSEIIAMLNFNDQKAYQWTKPPYSQGRDGTVLEMAVLGACQCPGVIDCCPCARTAAASSTQLQQLRQELDLQFRRREEALLVADAFRVAFEQQLRKRSEHLLLVTEARTSKSQGANRGAPVSVAQKLRAILPSIDSKASLEYSDTLHRLLDLLNDRDIALAHQRKVSLMLARHAEALEKQLGTDCKVSPGTPSDYTPQPQDASDSASQTQDASDSASQTQDASDSASQQLETSDSTPQRQETSDSTPQRQETSDSTPQRQETSDSTPQRQETSDSTPQRQETSDSTPQRQETSDSTPQRQETSDSTPQRQETSDSTPQRQETSDSTSQRQETPDSTSYPPETIDSIPKPQKMSDFTSHLLQTYDTTPQPEVTSASASITLKTRDSTPQPLEISVSTPQSQGTSECLTRTQDMPSVLEEEIQQLQDSQDLSTEDDRLCDLVTGIIDPVRGSTIP